MLGEKVFEIPGMGHHLVLEFAGVTSIDLNNKNDLDEFLSKSIVESGGKIEGTMHKQFEPQGVSIVYILAESHFSIHTWPEYNSCALDYYYCGNRARKCLSRCEKIICDKFGWKNCTNSMLFERGGKTKSMLNHYDHSSTLFNNVRLVERVETEHQEIRVYDTEEMGRCLILDGTIQIAEGIEDNFTKDISKNVIAGNITYNHVLAIGSGDMALATYLLENFPVNKITVCEVDEKVPEICHKYFKVGEKASKLKNEGKINLFIGDGADYVKEAVKQKVEYDAIIIEIGEVSSSLFTKTFYQDLHAVLKKGSSLSQVINEETSKLKWNNMLNETGFKDLEYFKTKTPKNSVPLLLGSCKKE